MPKRIVVMTLAVLVSLISVAATAQDAKAPKLTLVDAVKDFGTVAKGAKLDHAFTIRNTGNADLEIIAVRPACGCTVAEFDKVIKPGQSGKVVAHVDTTSFTGPISKAVMIESNDTTNPTAQVAVHAVVKPFVEAYPAGQMRFNFLQGDVESQSIVLYSEETEPFEIVRIESPREWVKVEHAKITDEAQLAKNVGRPGQAQHRITVTAGGPDAKLGPVVEKVKIVTNSRHQPEYIVNLYGVVRPRYRVEPLGGVNFGEVAPNEPAATRSLLVRTGNMKDPASFAVTKVESSVPAVKTEIRPLANKGEYEVTLHLDEKAKPGDLAGEVKIYTTDDVIPVTTVPVKVKVKAVQQ